MKYDRAERYNLRQWTAQTVPTLAAVMLVATALTHLRFRIGWTRVGLAAITIFAIQAATVVPMFWAVRRWRENGDPRPGIALSGLYCLLTVLTGTHFAVQWRLVAPQNIVSEVVALIVIIAALIAFFSWRRSA